MKLLLIDGTDDIKSLFEHLNSFEQFDVNICEDTSEAEKIVKFQNIDIVIIDIDKQTGTEFLNYLLKITPKQRIITVSENWGCSDEQNAEHCKKNYNKRRLLKPICTHTLVEYLKNFDLKGCAYYKKFESIEGILSIMDDLAALYPNVKYDKTTNSVKFNDFNQLYSFTNKLSLKNIPFSVQSEREIRINYPV